MQHEKRVESCLRRERIKFGGRRRRGMDGWGLEVELRTEQRGEEKRREGRAN